MSSIGMRSMLVASRSIPLGESSSAIWLVDRLATTRLSDAFRTHPCLFRSRCGEAFEVTCHVSSLGG